MRKQFLILGCVMMVCTSLCGCGASKEPQGNDSVSVIESTEESTQVQNKVLPLPTTIDVENLDNCTVPISFEQGDAYVDDTGAMQMDVKVYTYDLYDMVDMSSLKEGDVIVIRGEEVIVESIEQNDIGLFINGGLENNGYEFANDESTVWYECGFNDAKSYYEIGEKTIRVSTEMIFYDNSDLDKGEIIYYPGDFLTDEAGIMYHFVPNNTEIVIEDGIIIEVHRRYMP